MSRLARRDRLVVVSPCGSWERELGPDDGPGPATGGVCGGMSGGIRRFLTHPSGDSIGALGPDRRRSHSAASALAQAPGEWLDVGADMRPRLGSGVTRTLRG
jgi:hypothetical protein